jgi:predicted lipid-binding transport protein (Tim44 family)
MKFKKLTVVFMSLGLIFSEMAFAGRFGGGMRSRGMQRSMVTTPQYSNKSYNSYNSYNSHNHGGNYSNNSASHNAAQPNMQRSGMGAGTAAMLGAAAGAAGGYMLGKNSTDNANRNVNNENGDINKSSNSNGVNANANAQEERGMSSNNVVEDSHIPWGIIIILLVLLGVGLMFFRKKTHGNSLVNPKNNFGSSGGSGNNFNDKLAGFSLSKFKRPAQNVVIDTTHNAADGVTQQGEADNQNIDKKKALVDENRMPDGIEKIYFLRQAKGMFLHIQSMNNPENVAEVAKYLTPELYEELHAEIAANTAIADFTNLDCKVLSAEQKDNVVIASVEFSGNVSEDPTKKPEPFTEVWNFVKPDIKINKWLVAGIQQVNPADHK